MAYVTEYVTTFSSIRRQELGRMPATKKKTTTATTDKKDSSNEASESAPITVSLTDQDALLAELRSAQTRISYLEADNHSLREKLQAQAQDHLSVSNYLQEEVQKKTEQTQSLKDRIDKQNSSLTQITEQVAATWRDKLDRLIAERDNLQTDNDRLQTLVSDTEDFRAQWRAMMNKIEDLERELKANEAAHKREMETLEHTHLQDKLKNREAFEAQLAETYSRAEESIKANLKPAQRLVRKQNDGLAQKLSFMSSESEKERRKATEAETKIAQINIDLDIQRNIADDAARRSSQLSQQLRVAKARIDALDDALTTVEATYKERMRDLEAQKDAEIDSLEGDVQGLKKLVQLKSKELAKVRGLAARILQQRTDLEFFLTETLEEARVQLAEEAGGEFLPERPRLGPITVKAGAEIRELTWAERERVLVDMVDRINRGRR
ncbi:Chromosome partition protein Smc [Carpediemonas membranifera]|uniref:Chromosome partition protein Smc n=1 Tax=Carpediemonas membranifera TaxID=201153 RepID=A0A8J6B5A1_9EUKA|nr:Chromosome partition protein Smc [Carpediemonas membranifera]|eukprot:KAG9393167.1 Chromosome partition protein Smc [Carpediemonas membranifera]